MFPSVSSRIAFVDLMAGPFNWGPVVGGESVKSDESLPKVQDITRLTQLFAGRSNDRFNGRWSPLCLTQFVDDLF